MCVYVKVKATHEMYLGTKVDEIYSEYMHQATQDIKIYKILKKVNGEYRSYFQDFKYEVGTKYKATGAKQGFNIDLGWQHLEVQGYHGWQKERKAYIGHSMFPLCEFVIPKGSYYFMDSDDDEIVADCVIFKGEVSSGV
jgi:hypothetical protein